MYLKMYIDYYLNKRHYYYKYLKNFILLQLKIRRIFFTKKKNTDLCGTETQYFRIRFLALQREQPQREDSKIFVLTAKMWLTSFRKTIFSKQRLYLIQSS